MAIDTGPFYFEAEDAGAKIEIPANMNGHAEYSIDGGTTWVTVAGATRLVTLENVGDRLYLRANANPAEQFSTFRITLGRVGAHGSVQWLKDQTGESQTAGYFAYLFANCTLLTKAPSLPATTLGIDCYRMMFTDTGLTTPPDLPATTLAQNCYQGMFAGCDSLTTAPALPATTLARGCYWQMFYGCTGLTTPPELPATTLAIDCYAEMFRGCLRMGGTLKTGYTGKTQSSHARAWLMDTAGGVIDCPPTASFDSYILAGWTIKTYPHAKKHGINDPANHDFSGLNTGYMTLSNGGIVIKNPYFVGQVVSYVGTTAPAGWLLCDGTAVSRETYAALFALIGTTYGAGDGETTFNLPDFRGKFLEGVPADGTLGTSVAAGLPNITGGFNPCVTYNSAGSLYANGANGYTGAVTSNTTAKLRYFTAAGTATTATAYGMKFNASLSSPIYGASDTVQPAAVLVNYIIYAGE